MFNYKVNLSFSFFIILLINVIYVKSHQDQTSNCIGPSYFIENRQEAFDVKDIVLLNCGRVRRSVTIESNVTTINTKNVTNGTGSNHTNNTNISVTPSPINATLVPRANATLNISIPTPIAVSFVNASKDKNATKLQSTPSPVLSTIKPTPPATLINASLTTDTNLKKNAAQKPTKIDIDIPTHNLGENGTGIRHITTPCNATRINSTVNTTACVSDPIVPEDANSNINFEDYEKTPEKLFGEHNVTKLKTDYHSYYNSTLITDTKEFENYWNNVVVKNVKSFNTLSLPHRKAVQQSLKFVFPFYGQPVNAVFITSGGFINTGPNVHFWLAATHYIAPLMANFESVRHEDSVIKLFDNGTSLTVLWENLTLNDLPNAGKFTFATSIFDDGNIIFAYKTLPLYIENIPADHHPVKIGLSDAYEVDHVDYFLRNKQIYEYHLIDFKNHSIINNTLIHLIPLPTCPQYDTCKTCLDNDSKFTCYWCPKAQRCSSGLDRLEQDWAIQNCHKERITVSSNCSASDNIPKNRRVNTNAAKNVSEESVVKNYTVTDDGLEMPQSSSSSGGIIACLMAVIVLGGFVGWIVYAYRNPHTNSGQLLIKYRPSQWSWRRGEARYTAATIHM